jgi:hypothetical protein
MISTPRYHSAVGVHTPNTSKATELPTSRVMRAQMPPALGSARQPISGSAPWQKSRASVGQFVAIASTERHDQR